MPELRAAADREERSRPTVGALGNPARVIRERARRASTSARASVFVAQAEKKE
jgi:hypothetical protein